MYISSTVTCTDVISTQSALQ